MPTGLTNTQTYFKHSASVIHVSYRKAADNVPPLWPDTFNERASDPQRDFITDQPVTGLGNFAVQDEGGVPRYDNVYEQTPVTAIMTKFGLAYTITEDAEMNDVANLLAELPGDLARSSNFSQDVTFWPTIQLAFTAGVIGADGQTLCSALHPLGFTVGSVTPRYGTYSNTLGATALTPESLQAGLNTFALMVDERAQPTNMTAERLICRPELWKTAVEVVASPDRTYTQDVKVNVVKDATEVRIVRYLSSVNAWFLLSAKGAKPGRNNHSINVSFKYRNKQRTWEDGETGNMSHRSNFKAAWWWSDWRGICGSQGFANS